MPHHLKGVGLQFKGVGIHLNGIPRHFKGVGLRFKGVAIHFKGHTLRFVLFAAPYASSLHFRREKKKQQNYTRTRESRATRVLPIILFFAELEVFPRSRVNNQGME